MADISAEIAAFRNAVYGEDVRSSMISLANKVNNESSAAATTVTGYAERLSAIEADGYVTTAKLADGAVNSNKLADGAVTDAKLAQSGGVLEKVDDLKSSIDNLTISIPIDLDTGATSGKYITTNGSIGTLAAFSYSEPFLMPPNSELYISVQGGNNGSTSVIAIGGLSGTLTSVVNSIDNTVRNYYYKNETGQATYAYVTYNNSATHSARLVKLNDIIKDLQDDVEVALNKVISNSVDLDTGATSGKYITINGSIGTLESFSYSAAILLQPNYTIKATVRSSSSGIVSAIAQYTGSAFVNLVSGIDNADRTYTYKNTGTKAIYVVVIYNNTVSHTATVVYTLDDKLDSLEVKLDSLEVKVNDNTPPYASFSMFQTFGVIGDSYASGEVYISGVPHDYFDISWGQVLARMCGNTCTNFSVGGLSTRTWLTNANGLAKLNSESAKQLYICALGLNDYRISDYLGTIADIQTEADTFYGNYGKIINAVIAKSPNAKIIMSTMANDNTETKAAFNEAIIAIANYFSIPCIDQRENDFFQSSFYSNGLYSAHPIGVVYSGMAKAIRNMIEDDMVNNYEYYDDYAGSVS